MKYSTISDQVQSTLGLPDSDKPRLLRQINLLRRDIGALTDFEFLRRVRTEEAYVAGAPIVLQDYDDGAKIYDAAGNAYPGRIMGVRLVKSTDGTLYYHGTEGMIPDALGLRFWSWSWGDVGESNVRSIKLWNADATEVSSDTVNIYYWIAPTELTAETVETVDIEFTSTQALVSGLTGRWHRYEERDPEKAIEPEEAFERDLTKLVAQNPMGHAVAVVRRGGLIVSPSDRP